MFGISDFGLFVAAVLLLNATPGPDTAYIVGRSLAQGRAAGLVSALGISAGCVVHALASALGLSAILAASATAFMIIKLAGGAYLVYLGFRMLLARPAASGVKAAAAPVRALPTIFWQAAMTNVLNPRSSCSSSPSSRSSCAPTRPARPSAFCCSGSPSPSSALAGTAAPPSWRAPWRVAPGRRPALKLWLERLVGASFVALGARLALSRN